MIFVLKNMDAQGSISTNDVVVEMVTKTLTAADPGLATITVATDCEVIRKVFAVMSTIKATTTVAADEPISAIPADSGLTVAVAGENADVVHVWLMGYAN